MTISKRGESNSYRWWVLLTVSLGSISVAFDNSILVTVLPRLAAVFRTDSSVVSWVNLVYLITSQSLMLVLARIGDTKGRRKVFMTGMAFYTAGLIGCACAQNVASLIAARAIQGVGAATGYSLTMAMAVAVFPPEERGKAIGILAGCGSAGLVVGPVIGGLLLDLLGWRGVFYARTPIAMAALLMTWLIVKEQKGEDKAFRLDVVGAAGMACFVTSYLVFLSFGGKRGFFTPSVLAAGALSAASLIWFVITENRARQPVLRLGLFRRRLFAASTVTGFFNGWGAATMTFLVPFYLVQGLGFSGSAVGLTMAIVAAPLLVFSPVAGRLSDRFGTTVLCTLGMVFGTVGLFLLSRPISNPSYTAIAVGVALVGIGTAVFLAPNNSAIVGSVPKEMLALAAGVAVATRQVGTSSGVAIAGALYGSYQSRHFMDLAAKGVEMAAAKRLASIAGFPEAMLIGAIVSTLGIATSLVRSQGRRG